MSFNLLSTRLAGETRRPVIVGSFSRPLVSVDPTATGPVIAPRGEVSATNVGTAAITLTLPATTQVGDTVVLLNANDFYTLAALATPTGTAVTAGTWTEITSARYDGGSPGGGFPTTPHIKAWIGTVTTGGASTVIANWAAPSGGDEERYAHALVFPGTFSSDAATSTVQSAGTAWTAPSINAAQASSFLLILAMTSANAATALTNFTFPGSMTVQPEADNVVTFRSGWELLTSSGATGTRSITSSASLAGAIAVLSIQPPSVGTTYQGAVSLPVTATLTLDPFLGAAAAVSLTATATLAEPAVLTAQGAVSLAASTSLSATPAPIAGAVSLTTAQSLTTAGAVSQPGSATLTATSSLTVGGFQTEAAAVSLAATSTLSATGTLNAFAATALSATGVLSVAGVRTTSGAVSLSAVPVLSAAAFLTLPAAVSLAASTALSTTSLLGAFGAVSLPAVGVLTVTVGAVGASATLTTAQTLTSGVQLNEFAAVSLTVVSSLSVAAVRTTDGSVTLSVVPVLSVAVTVRITTGATALAALGTLTVDGTRIANVVAGGVPLVAVGGLSVNGSTGSGGGANLGVLSVLTVAGVRVVIGTTQLTVLPVLGAGGIAVEFAAVVLTATSTLSVNAIVVKPGAVSLVSVGLLLANAAIYLSGSVNLAALPSLTFIELFPTIDVYATGDWALDGTGLHRGRTAIDRPKSGWTTDGIHVGSVHS